MKLLAMDTSTEACSVALWIDGEVRERFEIAPRRHTELVLPWADELLAQAGLAKSQLDAIAVGRGPGAFTGVRLAVALAQGMALALDIPVVPVSTLAALAMQVKFSPSPANAGEGWGEGANVLAAIDARMGEIYFGVFHRCENDVRSLGKEWIATADDPQLSIAGEWHGLGTGFAAAEGRLRHSLGDTLKFCDPSALPHAADVARLAALAFARGDAIAADQLEPAYLRDKVALTLAEQNKARGGNA
jgi:tRNA threonylcarbamoyladenosine biosynthesis protein TsaB